VACEGGLAGGSGADLRDATVGVRILCCDMKVRGGREVSVRCDGHAYRYNARDACLANVHVYRSARQVGRPTVLRWCCYRHEWLGIGAQALTHIYRDGRRAGGVARAELSREDSAQLSQKIYASPRSLDPRAHVHCRMQDAGIHR